MKKFSEHDFIFSEPTSKCQLYRFDIGTLCFNYNLQNIIFLHVPKQFVEQNIYNNFVKLWVVILFYLFQFKCKQVVSKLFIFA